LIQYIIDPDVCVQKATDVMFAQELPDGAIVGETKQVHAIDVMKCGKCGICYDVCKFDAIYIE